MKLLLAMSIALSALLSAGYFFSSMHQNRTRIPEDIVRQYSRWLVDHGKLYATPSEYNYRLGVFYGQTQYIAAINKDYDAAAAASGQVLTGPMFAMNGFGDLTVEEFKVRYTGASPLEDDRQHEEATEPQTPSTSPQQLAASNLGQSYSIRIKNQGGCGSCWAFAAVAALEKFYFDKNRVQLDFSQQHLVDCTGQGTGCSGGLTDRAFNYVASNGISRDSQYPYKAAVGNCANNPANNVKVGNSLARYAPYSHSTVVRLAKMGVHVAVEVYSSGKFRYISNTADIYDARTSGECDISLDHIISVSGATAREDTLNVYNSWGTGWGNGGHKAIRGCSETAFLGRGRFTHPNGNI